jgi:hypothetical protein
VDVLREPILEVGLSHSVYLDLRLADCSVGNLVILSTHFPKEAFVESNTLEPRYLVFLNRLLLNLAQLHEALLTDPLANVLDLQRELVLPSLGHVKETRLRLHCRMVDALLCNTP